MFLVLDIKSLFELTWEDIPYIESPVFAIEHVKDAIGGAQDYWSARVTNIYEFAHTHSLQRYSHTLYNAEIESSLRFLFSTGSYFSVARNKIPFAASFNWRELDNHPDGGEWYISHYNYADGVKQKLEAHAKYLGAKRRRMLAEQAEDDAAALISAAKRVVEKSVAEKSVAGKSASQPARQSNAAKSLDECEKRLGYARERLYDQGYQAKYTDEQQLAKVKNNEVSKERFLISFQTKNTAPDAKLAYQRNSGLMPVWATSFDQLENADTDPELIAKVLGTRYYPEKDYVLHIVDRGENLELFGQNTLTPTWDNMQEPIQKYLGGKHDPAVLSDVMTPEYQRQYAKDMNIYHKSDLDEFDGEDQEVYVKNLILEDRKKFNARHNVRTEIGANNEFTGNGLTQSREGSTEFGVVETLTLENNPSPMAKMDNVKTINLTPRKVV